MLINKIKSIKIPLRSDNQFSRWRLLNIIISGISLTGILLAIIFIYRNINTALVNAAIIGNIKSNVTFDILDLAGFERAKKIIDYKKQLPVFPPNVRNIFIYNVSSEQTKK